LVAVRWIEPRRDGWIDLKEALPCASDFAWRSERTPTERPSSVIVAPLTAALLPAFFTDAEIVVLFPALMVDGDALSESFFAAGGTGVGVSVGTGTGVSVAGGDVVVGVAVPAEVEVFVGVAANVEVAVGAAPLLTVIVPVI
jgi:hypothetical protein